LLNDSKAVIFVNGEMGDEKQVLSLIKPQDLLIAADGGMHHMRRLGLRPHILIGDLDSTDPALVGELRLQGVQIMQFPREKDETDLELALNVCLEKGIKTIYLVAALGGRLDHLLGNILLLTNPQWTDCDLRILDGITEAALVRGRLVIAGNPGDLVSLLPLSEFARNVRTQGLAYPLDDETLCRHKTRGISNVLTTRHAEIEVSQGDLLLCIHTRNRG
jgi:thiamine pyrophosphokinase